MRLRKPGSGRSTPAKSTARERAAERERRKDQIARPAGRREAAKDRYGSFGGAAKRSGVELLAIARELVRIPAEIFLGIAERLGAYVLAAWLWVWPFLVRAWHLAGRALGFAQRAITPARATVAVALLTAVALAGSQWADLSAISVGIDAYIGLEDVAPAPEVSAKTVGSEHAWIGVPLALLAVLLILASATGRPKLSLGLVPVGATVVAISILVDRPAGLDEGTEAVAYESVMAELLVGFWAQLVSGAVLILLAPVLYRVIGTQRPEPARRARSRPGPGGLRSRLRPRRPRRTAEAGR